MLVAPFRAISHSSQCSVNPVAIVFLKLCPAAHTSSLHTQNTCVPKSLTTLRGALARHFYLLRPPTFLFKNRLDSKVYYTLMYDVRSAIKRRVSFPCPLFSLSFRVIPPAFRRKAVTTQATAWAKPEGILGSAMSQAQMDKYV